MEEKVRQINGGITINVDVSLRNIIYVKYWNPATYSYENEKYLVSIMDDSAVTCDKTIEKTKTVPTSLNKKINL